jgi:hypothetical protein
MERLEANLVPPKTNEVPKALGLRTLTQESSKPTAFSSRGRRGTIGRLEANPVPSKTNNLPEALGRMTDQALEEHIISRSIDLYRDQPKDLQVNAVSSLVRGKHTFVRVGTGFGKTRISEMYFGLFEKNAVVLVLNPLDSLGDDQVGLNCT